MKIQLAHKYEDIVSLENLLEAWSEFVKGKRYKKDVLEFSLNLMDNIFKLHKDLSDGTYKHGLYQAFNICDPKPRNIHKANVRDRLLHHAIHRKLYPFFDKIFISDIYSSRLNKGTHKALNRFIKFGYIISKNNTKTCHILKCDIKKFFENIDHDILLNILKEYIPDKNTINLLDEIMDSFHIKQEGKGLPLGNLTSQLFVNIYMNKFDQFVKHKLKVKYYIRYADDFIILSNNKQQLENYIFKIDNFLKNNLKLQLHPNKLYIKTLHSGLDFLGWVHFPDHRVLRTSTKRRMMRNISINTNGANEARTQSYLGFLKHGNTYKLKEALRILGSK